MRDKVNLIYPLASEPGTGDGTSVEIAPGVHWLRMPLAGSLRWINVWALLDHGGLCIVDTGIHNPETVAAWTHALAGGLLTRRIRKVLVTHMHPDHVGMAGWFVEKHAAQLWMSRLEYLTCRLLAADTGHPAPPQAISFYRAAGWTEEALDRYRGKFGYFGQLLYPMPASYRRLSDATELQIGEQIWRVIMGNGHSPEHACLYCPALKLLIAGDQVLPKISSNVSVFPTEPDADPLSDWLSSLSRIQQLIPDDTLVLPAHNSPFRGLHARIAFLIRHHQEALKRLHAHLQTSRRAVDCFSTLFARPITADSLTMATGEAIAHLNHLHRRGTIDRELDAAGVWHWSSV